MQVLISAGSTSLRGPLTFDELRRWVLADFYARFRRMRGDAVLFSLGFDSSGNGAGEDATKRRRELESFDLSIDWERSFDSADAVSQHWVQRMFLVLYQAGMLDRAEAPMAWCERCKMLLPRTVGDGDSCLICADPLRQIPAGEWLMRLDANERLNGNASEGMFSRALTATATIDLLGCTEGAEIDAEATDGTTFTVFTRFPDKIEEARFVGISPRHRAIETLIQDPGVINRIGALRSEGVGSDNHNLVYPAIVDTGVWVHVPPLPNPLPLVVSLSADARFGVTAFLGIPFADARDEEIARCLPGAPKIHWSMRAKQARPQPSLRFRAHRLPLSTGAPNSIGTPIPLIDCADCRMSPLPLSPLPGAVDLKPSCPKCGKPGRQESGMLDPRVANWAEMLITITPNDRPGATPSHPELRRWMSEICTFHSAGASSALLSNLVLTEALEDLEPVDSSLHNSGHSLDLVVGSIVDGALSSAVYNVEKLAARYGSDAVRFTLLHAAAPPNHFESGEMQAVLSSATRFINRLRSYAEARLNQGDQPDRNADNSDHVPNQLRKWCRTCLWKVTENNERLDAHRATRNLETFLSRIEDFELRARDSLGGLSAEDARAIRTALCLLIAVIAPIAPKLADELSRQAGSLGGVSPAHWPERVDWA
jgi:leucyl-tRNA synthetase